MRKALVFVNYEHPSHIKDRTHRHIVSTHTGKYSQQLLRSTQSAPAPQRHVEDSGPATTYGSTYSQPHVLSQDVQPAQAPSDNVVQASQRSPSRHGLIVRERRRCVFSWHHRHHNQRSASHNAQWEPYHTPTSPKSHQPPEPPVIGKDYNTIRQRVSSTVRGIPRSESPLSLLGQGRVDPFARFAIDEDYSYLHEVIDHGQPSLLKHITSMSWTLTSMYSRGAAFLANDFSQSEYSVPACVSTFS